MKISLPLNTCSKKKLSISGTPSSSVIGPNQPPSTAGITPPATAALYRKKPGNRAISAAAERKDR
ncbi:hypothetical protein D3C72_1814170 [compost metagenome]